MFMILLPLLYLYSTALCTLHPGTMCGVDLATMKQLLADQRRFLINDMKGMIVSQVATQLAPHTARLDQLQEDQNRLKTQLSELTNQLNTLSSSAYSNTQPSSGSVPVPCGPTIQERSVRSNHSSLELPEAEIASRTISFRPIPCDITAMKTPSTEQVPPRLFIESAFLNFLKTSMKIPSHIISDITWLEISHKPENSEITVLFPTKQTVKTIFRHVKNLSPGEKVSSQIPPILASRYNYLKNKAYLLRNGETRHKTVIRYLGNSLELYVRPPNSNTWKLVQESDPDPEVLVTLPSKN